jgi:hypothetical protein
MVIYPFLLAAGAGLLDGPAVAIWVVEVDEPDVVEGLAFASRARAILAVHLDLGGLHLWLDELRAATRSRMTS